MTLALAKMPTIGNIDLTQYEVFPSLQYNDTISINRIDVNIRLQCKLSSHIFNTYIPTLCLVTITGFTLFIDTSHFEATIMVALTTMLVMYTLHQSITVHLPMTAYLKMIDIWLFGGLIVPFIISGILIFYDHLVLKEANQVVDTHCLRSEKKLHFKFFFFTFYLIKRVNWVLPGVDPGN